VLAHIAEHPARQLDEHALQAAATSALDQRLIRAKPQLSTDCYGFVACPQRVATRFSDRL